MLAVYLIGGACSFCFAVWFVKAWRTEEYDGRVIYGAGDKLAHCARVSLLGPLGILFLLVAWWKLGKPE